MDGGGDSDREERQLLGRYDGSMVRWYDGRIRRNGVWVEERLLLWEKGDMVFGIFLAIT